MNFVARWLATAVAVAAAAWIVPGVEVVGGTEAWVAVALVGLVLALVNIAVKPILQIISLPITVFTLGIFYLVVNTGLLYLASGLTDGLFHVGLEIGTFGSGFVAAIVISIVTAIMNGVLGSDD